MIRISSDILWRVFHILTEPVAYTFVSVNRRNNEARDRTAVGPGSGVKLAFHATDTDFLPRILADTSDAHDQFSEIIPVAS